MEEARNARVLWRSGVRVGKGSLFGRFRGALMALGGAVCLVAIASDVFAGAALDIEILLGGPIAFFGGLAATVRPQILTKPRGIDALIVMGVVVLGLSISGVLALTCGVTSSR